MLNRNNDMKMFIKRLFITALPLVLLLGACSEIDETDIQDIEGNWVLTQITARYDDGTEISTPADIDYYLFLMLFDDGLYDYVLMGETGTETGRGEWDINSVELIFYDFQGKTLKGPYEIDYDQFTFTTNDLWRDPEDVTLEFTVDLNNVDLGLVGEWELTETFYTEPSGTMTTTPQKEDFYVTIWLDSDGSFDDKVIDNGQTSRQSGAWNVALDVLRTYYNSGVTFFNRYARSGNNLFLSYKYWDETIDGLVAVTQTYEKK